MHNIVTYLDQNEKLYGNKTLFSDSEIAYTYSELKNLALKIATSLLVYDKRKSPVIIFAERKVEPLAMMFGVLYSGNFYVPIDPELPTDRIESIISTLNAEILYTTKRLSGRAKELSIKSVLYIEDVGKEIKAEELAGIKHSVIDTDPAYAIFTSGSTGVPKGVLVSHRSVIDLMIQFKKEFEIKDTDILGNQAPFDFDVSVKDIYSTVSNGASMVVLEKALFVQPANLVKYLDDKKITVLIWAVSALNIIAAIRALKNCKPDALRLIMFSGEAISNKVLNYFRENLPSATYVNLYGPTEITCNCTFYRVDRAFEDGDPLPIGKAFENTEILLLDEDKLITEKNMPGEICVRGSSLALGYFNEKGKTEKVFCQNPLNTAYPERIYRTGDIAYLNEYGELVFASRKDSQIKHMGHRIELGEIEVVVNALDYIHSAVCAYINGKIVLFYAAETEKRVEIIKDLTQKLPRYMCPNRYIYREKLPMSAHGKIDRQKLIAEYKDGKD